MRKKRMKHRTSIMHSKEEHTCYLCMKLHGDRRKYGYLEEHHIFNGPDRKKSEEYGLKVYLDVNHHRIGQEAVHNNIELKRMLQQDGQRAFQEEYPNLDFMKMFGKNYL